MDKLNIGGTKSANIDEKLLILRVASLFIVFNGLVNAYLDGRIRGE